MVLEESSADSPDYHKEQQCLKHHWRQKGQNRSCPTSGTSWEAVFFGEDNNARENRKHQEKRKTKCEMD